MPDTNVQADPMFQLLTDALRAGPGSPEWHQAVSKLRQGGVEHADEYRLLVAVREHLESGRDYRSIRAGPGFTRKLLEDLDKAEPPRRRDGPPIATMIAAFSGLVLLAVVAFVIVQWVRRGQVAPQPGETTDLQHAYFPTLVAQATFDAPAAGGAVPPGWKAIGELPLQGGKAGLRAGPTTAPASATVGGAVVLADAIPADEPFAAEATIRLNRPSDDLIVEFFVSADPLESFSADRSTSANELVWLLRGSRQQVVLGEDAQQKADEPRPEPPPGPKGDGRDVTVRILINRDSAAVESNKQSLWHGPHHLPANPRRVGVRFLRAAGGKAADPATVLGVKVAKK
jgi:hypothetical protein